MKYLKQMAYIFLICVAGQMVSRWIGGIVPGNVLAMVILLVLLLCGAVKLKHVEDTADFILANMAFLFVPATVSIFCNYEVFAGALGKLLALCLITMILTSLSAGFTVKFVLKLLRKRKS